MCEPPGHSLSSPEERLCRKFAAGLSPTQKRLGNALAVNVGWTACALGAAWGWPWVGPAVVALLVSAQLPLVASPKRQALFIAVVAGLGWAVDSALFRAGVFSFPGCDSDRWLCPLWMAALWANFATTLHLALDWLRGRYVLSAVLGAVAGPLAYYTGHRMGAMRLGESTAANLAVFAAEWAVVMPALVRLAKLPRLDGTRPPGPASASRT